MIRKVLPGVFLTLAGLTFSTAWAGPGHTHKHDDSHATHHQTPVAVARHLQQAHRFNDAADVLATYLYQSPLDSEAQLLYADVLRHAGRYDESRSACARVALAGATTLAGFCAIQVLVDIQEYARADEFSDRLANQITHLSNDAQIWALEISAEAAWRAGDFQEAKRRFQEAIGFDNVPHSTLDAYDQFLEVERLAGSQYSN